MKALHIPPVAAPAATSHRQAFVDNLRWVMIVLVIMMHAAVTYSHLGSWYYMAPEEPGPVARVLFAFFQSHLQAFFMGLLFLIAGYFVPGSCDRKGVRRFASDRALRLGAPTSLYVAIVQPAIVYYLLAPARGEPWQPLDSVFDRYFIGLQFLGGTGPMWFALALLIFTAVYALVRLAGKPPGASQTDATLPGNAAVLALIAIITAGAFLIRVVQPIGTSVLNMQLCYFAQYIVLFAVGIAAYRRNWLLRLPSSFCLRWFKLAVGIGPVLWFGLAIAVLTGGHGGTSRPDLSSVSGGWHWQSLASCAWESFFCVGFSLGLLVLCRDGWNSQGPLARFMSNNAFAVYVFHPPILIAITLGLRGFSLTPLENFLLATALAVPVCFLAAEFVLRRIPGLNRIL